jgi:hypothetical protein
MRRKAPDEPVLVPLLIGGPKSGCEKETPSKEEGIQTGPHSPGRQNHLLGWLAGGTDGFRLLCHQFAPSSWPRLGNCLSRCTTFWQKRNSFREATLLFSSTDDQGPNTRITVSPLNTGRQSSIRWWSRRNCMDHHDQHSLLHATSSPSKLACFLPASVIDLLHFPCLDCQALPQLGGESFLLREDVIS